MGEVSRKKFLGVLGGWWSFKVLIVVFEVCEWSILF